jgi:hypothetical protein
MSSLDRVNSGGFSCRCTDESLTDSSIGEAGKMTQLPLGAQPSQITVTAAGDVFGVNTPENRALARRVRACVNACEGIATEDLEQGVVREMRQIIQQLAPVAAEFVQSKDAERAA